MPFEGYVEDTSQTAISGWVWHSAEPDRALDVEILADGIVIATLPAKRFRQDLKAAGKGSGHHAFEFSMPNDRSASQPLRVRVVGKPWFLQRSGGFAPHYATIRHSCEYGVPEPRYGFSMSPPADPASEIPLARRLIAAYHAASVDGEKPEDIWTIIERSIFPDLLDILRRKDAEKLSVYMRDFFAQTISHGTVQGAQATAGLLPPGAGAITASQIADALASLSEAIGAFRVENPEQHGHYGENLFRDPDELIDRVNATLGIDIVAPNVAGRKFGLETRRGIVAAFDVRSVYAAHRIRELLRGVKQPSVCEIGGGIGAVAYYCSLLKIHDYTIIDLPPIGLMQAYWLLRTRPGAPVILCGEPDSGGPAIRLLPPVYFGKRGFGLIYNQDSFPEMHRSHSMSYLETATQIAPALLSINQESECPQSATSWQPVVSDLVTAVGGYRRAYRFPYWLRQGYVEELYLVESKLDVRIRRLRRFLGKKLEGTRWLLVAQRLEAKLRRRRP